MIFNKEKILIANFESGLQKILKSQFFARSYEIMTASNSEEVLSMYKREPFIIIILNTLMSTLNGFGVCEEIRKKSNIPIILLTTFGDLIDRAVSFDLKIDAYFIKPFPFKELELKIKTLLKNAKKNISELRLNQLETAFSGGIRVDTIRRQVYKYNKKIRLTSMEFSLLEFLLINSGKAVSRFSILKELWGYKPERDIDTRVVDVHISRLRSKLEYDPSSPDLILTVRGAGYFFQSLQID